MRVHARWGINISLTSNGKASNIVLSRRQAKRKQLFRVKNVFPCVYIYEIPNKKVS